MFTPAYCLEQALEADERAKAALSEEWRRLWSADAADWRALAALGDPALRYSPKPGHG